MIDDDDFALFAIAADPRSVFGFIVCIIVLIAIYFAVKENHEECAAVKCAVNETPMLINNECLCVAKQKGK